MLNPLPHTQNASSSNLVVTAQKIRKIVLDQSNRAHVGHIGSALSIADIIAALYSSTIQIDNPDDPERDRFVLSKGHAALALYAALFLRGWLTEADLDSFCADGTLLGVHPEYELRGVDFSSGSLGQGLSVGAGAALAARMQKSSRRIYVLISDAECNEGSIWEAAIFAAHHRLSNLTVIIDLNGQQAFGFTKDVLNIPNMAERWRAFGWAALEVDGNDTVALSEALLKCRGITECPQVLVARTVFGKGVSYMENQIKWHYMPMSEEEYKQAIMEVL